MAKGAYQKLKLLYLQQILLENTDEYHSMTMNEIISELKSYGIEAERKSIYDDLEMLKVYGLDIVGEKRGKQYYYAVVNRDFELPELKLLIDIVQSAKFITAKKSRQLIEKIEHLGSRYDACQLRRQVELSNRVKAVNEEIYYNIDKLNIAMSNNLQVSFQYYQWTWQKTMTVKNYGMLYLASPWALDFDNGKYYLIAFDSELKNIKHYRIDKMLNIEILSRYRDGREQFKSFDLPEYEKKTFSMFSGQEEIVTMIFANSLAGVVIDRFGEDINIRKYDDKHFKVDLKVALSIKFYSWVISFGNGAEVLAPEYVRDKLKNIGAEINGIYKD